MAVMKYRGLRAIARRMGWKSARSPLYHLEHSSFIMYRVWINRIAYKWETNDNLIFAWELARAKKSRQEYLSGIRRPYFAHKHKRETDKRPTVQPGQEQNSQGKAAVQPQKQRAIHERQMANKQSRNL